jgi:hypothetical protein
VTDENGPEPGAPTAEAELQNTREVAKGWWQGVTGLFGLFSIGTVVFAADAADGLANIWKISFGIAAFLAAGLSGIAIGYSLRAAHGWPSRKQLRHRLYHDTSQHRVPGTSQFAARKVATFKRESAATLTIKAAEDLRYGVNYGAAALGCLMVALSIVWFAQDPVAESTAFTVQAMDEKTGEPVACGVLVDLDGTDVVIGEPSSGTFAQEGIALKEVINCPP